MISDPIIIATIGACGVVAAALINNWRKHHPESQPTVKMPGHDAPSPTIQSQRIARPAALPRPVFIPCGTTDLSHLEIVESIERVPPYQSDAVEHTFIGLRVQWSGQLDSISHRRDGSLCVYVSLSDRASAFCETQPDDVHGLQVAPKGTAISIRGILERVGRYEAQLRECVISKLTENA